MLERELRPYRRRIKVHADRDSFKGRVAGINFRWENGIRGKKMEKWKNR